MKIGVWVLGWLLWSRGGTCVPALAGAQEPREGEAPAEPQYATWDRLFVKPELPLRAVREQGQVTLLLYHTYPTSLHHLRLRGRSDVLQVTTEPPDLAELEPTVIASVTLHLRRRGALFGDTAALPLEFSADEMSCRQTLSLTVPLTPPGEAAANEALSLPVGQVEVVVTKMGRVAYASQVAVALLLLAWLVGRRRKVGG